MFKARSARSSLVLGISVAATVFLFAPLVLAQEAPPPDPGAIASDFTLGYYVAGIAGAIHLLMWLLKFSTFLEAKIPARVRPLVAFGLGQIGAIFDMLVSGTPRSKAIVTGLIATTIAIATQETLWNGIFGGWEPARAIRRFFSKNGGDPPAGGAIAMLALVMGLAFGAMGCTPEAKSVVDAALDNAPLICAATLEAEQLLDLDETATKKICNVVETTEPFIKRTFDEMVAAKKASARKASAKPCK